VQVFDLEGLKTLFTTNDTRAGLEEDTCQKQERKAPRIVRNSEKLFKGNSNMK